MQIHEYPKRTHTTTDYDGNSIFVGDRVHLWTLTECKGSYLGIHQINHIGSYGHARNIMCWLTGVVGAWSPKTMRKVEQR